MQYDLFIRLTRPYEEIKEWAEWIPCQKKCAVQHDHDSEVNRTHTHLLVIGCSLQKLSLKTKLTRLHGTFTKGDWSFTEPNDSNHSKILTYLSKGKYEPMLFVGYDLQWGEIKSAWVEPTKLQTTMTNYKTFKAKGDIATQKDMIDRIILLINDESDLTIDNIISKIRQVFIVENRLIVGRYKIRDIVDTIMAREQPESWKLSIKRFCEYRT